MRNHFANLLEAEMDEDPRIVLLYGDIGNKLFDSIRLKYPSRAINCGVAEANMVSVAAGLASAGLKPVVYTISSFLYLKSLEQIKLDICYPGRSVVLIGTGGGFSYAGLGTTHHSLEDFATLGSIPGIEIFSPADRFECTLVLKQALENGGPAWIRLGKKGELDVHSSVPEVSQVSILPPLKIYPKDNESGRGDFLILSTGLVVAAARDASLRLREAGIAADVWSISQIKQFPEREVLELLRIYSFVLTVEEHVPFGGLYSLVRECSVAMEDTQIRSLSTGDCFHSSAGTSDRARARAGIDVEGIFNAIVNWNRLV